MASTYLQTLFNSLNLPKPTESTITSCLFSTSIMIQSLLQDSKLSCPSRRHRFKAPNSTNTTTSSYSTQKNQTSLPELTPVKLSKRSRAERQAEDQQKIVNCKEFTKRIIIERGQREKRIQARAAEFRDRLWQEIEELKKFESLTSPEQSKPKYPELRRSEVRRPEFANKKYKIAKPLYKQIEESYQIKRVIPQIEQQKAQLEKKHQLFKPLDPQELNEHLRQHDELKRVQDYRRKKENDLKFKQAKQANHAQVLPSKFTHAVMENDRREKEEKEKARLEKIANAQKRLQYSKLVKEMFVPTVDERRKEKEKEESLARLRKSRSGDRAFDRKVKIGFDDFRSQGNYQRVKERERFDEREGEFESDERNYGKFGRKNFEIRDLYGFDGGSGGDGGDGKIGVERNGVKEERRIKRINEQFLEGYEPVEKPDYIAEFRTRREMNEKNDKEVFNEIFNVIKRSDLSQERVNKIVEKTEIIENRAKRKELHLDTVNMKSKKGIQTGDEVNEMIINTIRAKLALLDKLQSE